MNDKYPSIIHVTGSIIEKDGQFFVQVNVPIGTPSEEILDDLKTVAVARVTRAASEEFMQNIVGRTTEWMRMEACRIREESVRNHARFTEA